LTSFTLLRKQYANYSFKKLDERAFWQGSLTNLMQKWHLSAQSLHGQLVMLCAFVYTVFMLKKVQHAYDSQQADLHMTFMFYMHKSGSSDIHEALITRVLPRAIS